ncbi:hypothetical protein E2C01_023036 [Portunus trituberculatus]|uniref:Uncharacterized protein n=1 Tax=Portunus trituberculatus TaxID=210409 RepID=A0A5B7E8U9_PORTR|nr:hypothetical protein [Portunus trituberculatus]
MTPGTVTPGTVTPGTVTSDKVTVGTAPPLYYEPCTPLGTGRRVSPICRYLGCRGEGRCLAFSVLTATGEGKWRAACVPRYLRLPLTTLISPQRNSLTVMVLKIIVCVACVQAVAVGIVSAKSLWVQPRHPFPYAAEKTSLIGRIGPHDARHPDRLHHHAGRLSNAFSARHGGKGSLDGCALCPASHDISPCAVRLFSRTDLDVFASYLDYFSQALWERAYHFTSAPMILASFPFSSRVFS